MSKVTLWLIVGILLLYFIPFTSGLVYEVEGSDVIDELIVPFSFALSGDRTGLAGVFTPDDVKCVEWLAYKSDRSLPIVGDYNASHLMRSYVPDASEMWPRVLKKSGYERCYVIVRGWNYHHGEYIFSLSIIGKMGEGLRTRQSLSSTDIASWQEVFRSGDSAVYLRDVTK